MTESSPRKKVSILVVDDDESVSDRIKKILMMNGYSCVKSLSNISSFEELHNFDVLIIDIYWPTNKRPYGTIGEQFGFEVVYYLKRNSPKTKIVLMSASLFDLEDLARIEEADSYFKSSDSASKILNTIQQVIDNENPIDPINFSNRKKALEYISIAIEAIEDGKDNPSILGIDTISYKKLYNELQSLKSEIENNKNPVTYISHV